jgi:hypothetical protein
MRICTGLGVLTCCCAASRSHSSRPSNHCGSTGCQTPDGLALVGEWGFALDDPAMPPVGIWHGDQDRMVPYAYGEWLTRKVPGARAHLMPGEGCFSLVATAIGDANMPRSVTTGQTSGQ